MNQIERKSKLKEDLIPVLLVIGWFSFIMTIAALLV
jgi:hypothetical protein